jgi:hypothetical protein
VDAPAWREKEGKKGGPGTAVGSVGHRGEAGHGVSGGVHERAKRREAGWRWGTDTWARVAQRWAARFKLGLNRNQNSNETKLISNSFKL